MIVLLVVEYWAIIGQRNLYILWVSGQIMDKSIDNSPEIVHFMVEYAFKDVSLQFMAVGE